MPAIATGIELADAQFSVDASRMMSHSLRNFEKRLVHRWARVITYASSARMPSRASAGSQRRDGRRLHPHGPIGIAPDRPTAPIVAAVLRAISSLRYSLFFAPTPQKYRGRGVDGVESKH